MKKYILILLAAFVAYACVDTDYNSAFQEYIGINPGDLATEIVETADSVAIPIIFGGETTIPEGLSVTYTITGGSLGETYTLDDNLEASGTLPIAAGKLGETYIVIRGTEDFDVDDNFDLVVTITGVNREGVRLGYPFVTSHTVTVKDDDCAFEFEGPNEGVEMYFDLIDYTEDADVTITHTGGTQYTIEGLGHTMLSDPGFWNETITDSAPTVATIAPGGAITIEPQYLATTLFNGNPSVYNIRGTGLVNYCDGTTTITYDVYYADEGDEVGPGLNGSLAAYVHSVEYMTSELFIATLTPVE